MGRNSAIEVVEEIGPDARSPEDDTSCPVCGAPNGKLACGKCGWGVEDLAPQFSENILDPVTTMRDARLSFKRMKDEISTLKNINQLLLQNNQRFTDLVEVMRALVSRLCAEAGKKYVYSYAEGGWGEAGADGKMTLALKKEVTVEDINKQLAEIVRLISRYGK
ncbi:MAG: hypothetical protein V1813_03260 [Candidatus Aenigmatarchaeota archaeon]